MQECSQVQVILFGALLQGPNPDSIPAGPEQSILQRCKWQYQTWGAREAGSWAVQEEVSGNPCSQDIHLAVRVCMSGINSAEGWTLLVLGALSSHVSLFAKSRLHTMKLSFQLECLVRTKRPLLLRLELNFQLISFHSDSLKTVQLLKEVLIVEQWGSHSLQKTTQHFPDSFMLTTDFRYSGGSGVCFGFWFWGYFCSINCSLRNSGKTGATRIKKA